MNSNTIVGYIGGTGRNQIASQTLASVTETEFKVNQDAGAANAIAVLVPPLQTDIIGSGNPVGTEGNSAQLSNRGLLDGGYTPSLGRPGFTSGSFDKGRPFLVRLAGVITPASNGANTLDIKIYFGTTKGGTVVADTGAMTGTETSVQAGAFIVEAQLIWDSVGQIIGGQQWYSVVAGATPTYNTWKALTNNVTGVTLANLKFCASAQWGNAAGGVVAVSEFSISQL